MAMKYFLARGLHPSIIKVERILMSSRFRGIFALLIVTLVWGTTFPAMKDLTSYFSPVWIVFIRFALAGLLLSPFLRRATLADCKVGALLGVLLFICYMFQLEGLALTSSNRNAFITGLNVLVVPLLGVIAGKLPERRIVIAIVLAVVGLFALCWDGGAWGRGDTLALLGALCFGGYVKMVEVSTRRVSNLMTLTAVQIISVACCAALWLLLREAPHSRIDVSSDLANYLTYIMDGVRLHFYNLAYLGVIATAAIISLQTWGQRHSNANEAAVIYAFEPACAAIAAFFWVGEAMTVWGMCGAVLLISGMIVSQWNAAEPKVLLVPD
jgi:drug/metabolite transporter (DMT)-like permease